MRWQFIKDFIKYRLPVFLFFHNPFIHRLNPNIFHINPKFFSSNPNIISSHKTKSRRMKPSRNKSYLCGTLACGVLICTLFFSCFCDKLLTDFNCRLAICLDNNICCCLVFSSTLLHKLLNKLNAFIIL